MFKMVSSQYPSLVYAANWWNILWQASLCMDHGNNILYPLQHGFSIRRSCETHLIEFPDEITPNMLAGKQTDVLVMDFSKSFDKVSHRLLTYKLDHYGIHGNTNLWINNFLSGRSQALAINGESSDYIIWNMGCRKDQCWVNVSYFSTSMTCQKY